MKRGVKRTKEKPKYVKPPVIDKWWTTVFYGARGSGKSLHQARTVLHILQYLEYLYFRYPFLSKRAIVFSVQRFNKNIEKKYLGKFLYYWNDAKDLRFCPRTDCWKKEPQHRLHGCYLVFDDMATILPADNWNNTPVWMRKMFAQARHFGIRIIGNMQDPLSVDVNFRRYVDMAFRFRKIIGSRDPDETKKPVKNIWGWYKSRQVSAEILWKVGNIGEAEILMLKAKQKDIDKIANINTVGDFFKGRNHAIRRRYCEIYDTTQDVPSYKPIGFEHTELFCIDPKHDHVNKDAPNYCNYKKVVHNLV